MILSTSRWSKVCNLLSGNPLQVQERLSAGLAADVDNIVVVGEAVELGRGALGVGSHVLEVEPVADVQGGVKTDALGDAVDAVTGRTPDAILDAVGDGPGHRCVVDGASIGAEDLGDGVLVVEHDAAEIAVQAVVDVEHVAALAAVDGGDGCRVVEGAAGNDVAGDRERRRDVVPARLGDDVNSRVGGEVLVKGATQRTGHVLEAGVAAETSTNVEGLHLKSIGSCLLENDVGIVDRLGEGRWVRGAGSDVEADTHDVEAELAGDGEEVVGAVEGSAKLLAEPAEGGRVVGQDAQEELRARKQAGNLAQLVGVIEGHLADTMGGDIADVGVGLAWLGVDDACWVNAHGQDLLDLGLGGAVEAGS